jgi:hypothetical protein
MILVFPSGGSLAKEEESVFVRSFDKVRFNAKVQKKVKAGWVIFQMTSSFRRTPFGGITTYFCELRRGPAV